KKVSSTFGFSTRKSCVPHDVSDPLRMWRRDYRNRSGSGFLSALFMRAFALRSDAHRIEKIYRAAGIAFHDADHTIRHADSWTPETHPEKKAVVRHRRLPDHLLSRLDANGDRLPSIFLDSLDGRYSL